MKASTIIAVIGGLFSITMVGCATRDQHNPDMTHAAAYATVPGPGMIKTSDLVLKYKEQAANLRELARELEVESGFYSERQEEELAARKKKLAKEAREAADSADQEARRYRRQIPHGQLY